MEQKTLRQRLAPFLALMDGRFFPLLIVALPQAFVVYQWLEQGNYRYEGWATVFAVIGAMAFESIYVGVIAWAEGRADQRWVQGTTLASLGFSALVAVKVYWPGWQEELSSALLHAGFPLLAYCYSMTIHSALKGEGYSHANPMELEGVLMTVAGIDELKREAAEAVEAKYRPIIERGNQQLTELRHQLEQANQRLTAPDQEKTALRARVAELENALEEAKTRSRSPVPQTEVRLGEELLAALATPATYTLPTAYNPQSALQPQGAIRSNPQLVAEPQPADRGKAQFPIEPQFEAQSQPQSAPAPLQSAAAISQSQSGGSPQSTPVTSAIPQSATPSDRGIAVSPHPQSAIPVNPQSLTSASPQSAVSPQSAPATITRGQSAIEDKAQGAISPQPQGAIQPQSHTAIEAGTANPQPQSAIKDEGAALVRVQSATHPQLASATTFQTANEPQFALTEPQPASAEPQKLATPTVDLNTLSAEKRNEWCYRLRQSGWSYRAIAEQLGKSENTAKSYARAHAVLHQLALK